MYNIMRTEKLKDRKKISSAAAHNFRLRHQGNIDPSKTPLNQVMVNTLNADLQNIEGLQKAFMEHYKAIGAKINQDSVLAQEFIISASPKFFKGMKPKDVEQWAKHQVEFMKKEFGDNLKVAVLHLDEDTPHLHFMLTSEEKSLKAYKNRYGECFKETIGLNANRWDPKFLIGLHDRHYEHNKHYGLKRGEPGSKKKHKPVKDYYRELRALQARMEGRVSQLEMIPELTGIIDVLVETIEGLDPPNKSLTRVARLAASLARKSQEKEHGGQPPQTPQKRF